MKKKHQRYRVYGIQDNSEKTIFGRWRDTQLGAEFDLSQAEYIFPDNWKWHIEKEHIL